MYHHWNVPTIPPGLPPTTTVTLRSNCNKRWSIPLWSLDQIRSAPVSEDRCEVCVKYQANPA